MREYLLKLLPDRTLPGTSPLEDYFQAGPRPGGATQEVDAAKRAAVLADIRRQRRRSRHSVAA